eukprot:Platyproteum_vivax@DN12258_c0_g1_i1.p1
MSIGTGPSCRLAARCKNEIGGLILQAPYRTIQHAAERFLKVTTKMLVAHRWQPETEILGVECPILLIHGKCDDWFPYKGTTDMAEKYRAMHGRRANIRVSISETADHHEWDIKSDICDPIIKFFQNIIHPNYYHQSWTGKSPVAPLDVLPTLEDAILSLAVNAPPEPGSRRNRSFKEILRG